MPGPGTMGKVWKFLLLLLVITALVWLTTMWRWQSAGIDPDGVEVTLSLLVLPLVLTGVLALFVWQIPRLRAYAAAPIVPSAAAGAGAEKPGGAAAPVAAQERTATFMVLAACTLLRVGADWGSAHAAITSGECKPLPDAELEDQTGQEVFSARLPDLNVEAVNEGMVTVLTTLRAQDSARWDGFECPPEMLRALAAMLEAFGSIQEPLGLRLPALGQMPPMPSAGARVPDAAPAPLPRLVMRVALPAQWSAQSQQVATAWVTQQLNRLVEEGLAAAGQSPAMASTPQAAVQLHVHVVPTAEAFWLLLDQQLLQWHREAAPGLLLALAADCLICDSVVGDWARTRTLFSGSHPRGRVPGEGAAALLLASPQWRDAPGAEPVLATLYRASMTRRDKSADASGRVTAETLRQAVADALQGSGIEAERIKHLTTDADHRASRKSEVFEAVQEDLAHIEPIDDALCLGTGCGDLGVARLLACVALAVDKVKASDAPGLVLGTYPELERFAVAVTPPTAAQNDSAAPAAQAAA